MRKNLRIVQINGFRGLVLTLFIISCLVAGFVVFPSILFMNIWNFLAIKTGSFPQIDFLEGILLWAIIAFSAFVFSKRRFIVAVNGQRELTEEEVRHVMHQIRNSQINPPVILPKDFSAKSENAEPQTGIKKEQNNNQF